MMTLKLVCDEMYYSCVGNTNLLEVACKHYPFDEVLDLTDKENNIPYHLAMERRCSLTTIKICELLGRYPINTTLTNKHNRKPVEKKQGARDKRSSDKRYPVLEMASKQFQQQMKKKTGSTKKKVQKGLSPAYPEINISTTLSVTKLDLTMMAEDHPMVNKDFCSICACPLRDDTAPVEEYPNSSPKQLQRFNNSLSTATAINI